MKSVVAQLDELFPDHRAEILSSKWARVKEHIPIGKRVNGKVVLIVPFGAFLDIDVGFPALLQRPYMSAALAAPGDHLPELRTGQVISAEIHVHMDEFRQIGLVQEKRYGGC